MDTICTTDKIHVLFSVDGKSGSLYNFFKTRVKSNFSLSPFCPLFILFVINLYVVQVCCQRIDHGSRRDMKEIFVSREANIIWTT